MVEFPDDKSGSYDKINIIVIIKKMGLILMLFRMKILLWTDLEPSFIGKILNQRDRAIEQRNRKMKATTKNTEIEAEINGMIDKKE